MDELLGSKRKILLVGEGNFSFSLTLKRRMPSGTEMVATCYEGDPGINGMDGAQENMSTLEQLGARVMTSVDASQLHMNPLLSRGYFDCVIFQFPHVGGKGNIKKNRGLLKGFFMSASQMISGDGAVLVTLCNGQGGTPADSPQRKWCNSWQVVAMATYGNLILTTTEPFDHGTSVVYRSTGYRSQDKSFNTSRGVVHMFHRGASLPACSSERQELLSRILDLRHAMYDKVCSELFDTVRWSLNTTTGPLMDADIATVKESETMETDYRASTTSGDGEMGIPAYKCTRSTSAHVSPTTHHSWTGGGGCPDSLMSFVSYKHEEHLHCCVVSCLTSFCQETVPSSCIELVHGRCVIGPHVSPVMHYAVMVLPSENAVREDETDGMGRPESLLDFRTRIVGALQKVTSMQSTDETVEEVPSENGDKCTTCGTTSTCIINFSIPITVSLVQTGKSVVVGICLEQLVLNKLGLGDIRLLWSSDERWWTRLAQMATPTVPYSLYPPVYVHDLSFWESSEQEFDEGEFFDLIRQSVGDPLQEVELIGTFELGGRKSRCYRMTYQSCDQSLTREQAGKLQECVREEMRIKLDLTPR